jgi:hypothetical protein
MEKIIVNKGFSIQLRDLLKSWVMLIVYPVIRTIIDLYKTSGSFEGVNWQSIGIETAIATILFLADRYLQPSKVISTYANDNDAKKVAAKIARENPNATLKGIK